MFKFNKSLSSALSVLLIGASFNAFAMNPPDKEDHSAAAARLPQAACDDLEAMVASQLLINSSPERLKDCIARAQELFTEGNSGLMRADITYISIVPPERRQPLVKAAHRRPPVEDTGAAGPGGKAEKED